MLRKRQRRLNPGDLRNRVDVWANQKVLNELGETTYKFVKLHSLWAAVVPQTGSLQRQQADTMLTNVTHKIFVRHVDGQMITKDMQIFHDNHRYEIRYILNPYERDELLEIFCQELID